ncbi:Hypothetical protein LUCI_4580 [Lucifera butyrica]|uniref:YqgF/RNase H-like domain-containing protein n=1 Tax=Lucifera butyrica TaxID=1351585 RepID=A0A498REQ6_9FIRM|nr:pre-16S rRNA-processing nuclease YqgF [Lucifera butyrica]VBB09290.1 Hypothetical protein LUCI_4580 [Lucifera butyrica]
MEDLVVAVDPGRAKCGVAVVHRTQGALRRQVVETAALATAVTALAHEYETVTVILGDRTYSAETARTLAGLTVQGEALRVRRVDEHHTSEMARSRYWRENPPRGWKRLIPVTMQVPPVPIDDYVAVILAERYFCSNSC